MGATRIVNVCSDCYYYNEMGWDEREIGRPLPEPAPMSLIPDEELSPVDDEPESHFSWHPCDGCGNTLGGDRYECYATDLKTVWGAWTAPDTVSGQEN